MKGVEERGVGKDDITRIPKWDRKKKTKLRPEMNLPRASELPPGRQETTFPSQRPATPEAGVGAGRQGPSFLLTMFFFQPLSGRKQGSKEGRKSLKKFTGLKRRMRNREELFTDSHMHEQEEPNHLSSAYIS